MPHHSDATSGALTRFSGEFDIVVAAAQEDLERAYPQDHNATDPTAVLDGLYPNGPPAQRSRPSGLVGMGQPPDINEAIDRTHGGLFVDPRAQRSPAAAPRHSRPDARDTSETVYGTIAAEPLPEPDNTQTAVIGTLVPAHYYAEKRPARLWQWVLAIGAVGVGSTAMAVGLSEILNHVNR
jgi:hypothetical protein